MAEGWGGQDEPALAGPLAKGRVLFGTCVRVRNSTGKRADDRLICLSTDPWRSRGELSTIRSLDKGGQKFARGPEVAFARHNAQPLAREAARAVHRVTRGRS